MPPAAKREYSFTLAELQKLEDSDLQRLEAESGHGERWQEAVCWLGDVDHYRARRKRQEDDARLAAEIARARKPAPAVATAQSNYYLSKNDIPGICRGISKAVKEHVAAKISESAQNSQAAMIAGLAALAERVGDLERRYEGQKRHLKNLEVRITGEGKIERQAKAGGDQ
jgi:hypothetical protein